LKKFAVKPVEIPESNGEQCDEKVSYLKVVPSTKCWLDFPVVKCRYQDWSGAFYPLSSN